MISINEWEFAMVACPSIGFPSSEKRKGEYVTVYSCYTTGKSCGYHDCPFIYWTLVKEKSDGQNSK